jgi:hypothetical protein
MWLQRLKVKIMVGNQLSCLHFYSILLDEEHEDWLPAFFGMEKRVLLRDHQYEQKTWNVWELH